MSKRASANDDGASAVPANAEVPASSAAAPRTAPRIRGSMWVSKLRRRDSRPVPSWAVGRTAPGSRRVVRRGPVYAVTGQRGYYSRPCNQTPLGPEGSLGTPPGTTLGAGRRDRSEPPRHTEAQPLALAVHGFVNRALARVRVHRVATQARVVVERLAGQPRAAAEWERSARPHLPAPAAERAVELLAGGEVLAREQQHLVARGAADVGLEADEVEDVELRERHDREHVHGGARELLRLRDRHTAGSDARRHRLRDLLAAVHPVGGHAELERVGDHRTAAHTEIEARAEAAIGH